VINTLLLKCGFTPVDFLGGEGRFYSVCFIEALHLYPIFYLNLVTALGNVDPACNEAASNLGIGRIRRFFAVTLPLIRPGILAGGSLVLVWSFTELGTPLMFGYNRVTPVQVFNGLTELEKNPLPYSLVVLMLLVSVLLYLGAKYALGTSNTSPVKGSMASQAKKLCGAKRFLPTLLFAGVALLSSAPHIALVLSAFFKRYSGTLLPEVFTLQNFDNALSNELVLPSVVNSLKYSLLAMAIATVVGVLVALAAKRWRLRCSSVADLLSMLPLAVPGVVVAFGYLGMSVRYSWAAEYFNPVENPLWLLGLAYAVRRIPYVVRSVSAGLEQTPEELENAARNLGVSPLRVLFKITVPLIIANVMVGSLFAFSFSMLEVSDSLILAQKSVFFPITRALYELSQILGSGSAAGCAFGVWAMLFLAATLGVASAILGRKIGTIFKF
jgi:iron(III) transport system permease protein